MDWPLRNPIANRLRMIEDCALASPLGRTGLRADPRVCEAPKRYPSTVEIASFALMGSFLGLAVLRPGRKWLPVRGLLLAGFLGLQGWSRIHGSVVSHPGLAASELFAAGLLACSGIQMMHDRRCNAAPTAQDVAAPIAG